MNTMIPTRTWLPVLLCTLLAAPLAGCDFLGGLTGADDEDVDTVRLYPVQLDGEWGYINENGRIMIEPQYQWAGPFRDGRAHVYDNWRHGFIDEAGEWIVEPRFQDARSFSEGLAAVKMDGRWGYIDRSGSFAINPQFREPGDFSEGRAFVRDASYEWNYIDTRGQIIRSVDTPELTAPEEPHFSAGLALIRDEDQEAYGYIDREARPVIPLQYPAARAFSDGLAAVRISDRWGYINTNRETVINPRYIEAGNFREGLAPVRENTNTWGFADKNGRMVIEPQFDEARSFSEGLAAVQLYGLWGFVDKNGRMVVEPQFQEVGDFEKGLALIRVELPDPERDDRTITRYGYIDREGAYVWYPTN
ncbi:MAG: WG repeat-containing protein [Bacteroidetes bacterium]|nr:MAG: WG repeat-containing protein [Bacteroidota bacterium]